MKGEVLQSQFASLTTMAWDMHVSNEDKKTCIKAKMEVNLKKKKKIRFNNFKMVKNMGILTNA